MKSKQIIFSICISFLLVSAVAMPDSGRRDKRNLDVREYLDEVVTGMNEFEQQLLKQQNALQLLAERYAELVVKNQELLEQNGKLARQDADLAIQTANQNAALQRRNAELTNQITELTNQTQDLFRLNSQLVAKVADVERLGEAVTKREEALVKQNAELTQQLAQVGVVLTQSKVLQNTISSTIVTQTAQMHNFSLQNDQFRNTLRENVAELQQSAKTQSAVLDSKIAQISADSQQKLSRTEERINQLTNRISSAADVAKLELTAQMNDINARLNNSVGFLQAQASSATTVQTAALKNFQDGIAQRVEQLERKHANETQVLADRLDSGLDVIQTKLMLIATLLSLQRSSNEESSDSGPTVTFYRNKQYNAGSKQPEEFQFSSLSCSGSECCRNLDHLNDDSQSLRTRNVCVKAYLDKNCSGQSRTFGKHSSISDLGDFNDKISSVKPC